MGKWILLFGCAVLLGVLIWQLGQLVWKRRRSMAQDRARDELVRNRERLARLEAGGSVEHPIEVSSAAVVESRAASTRCAMCDHDGVGVDEHVADPELGERIRTAQVSCRRCGYQRTLYFRLVSDLPN